MSNTSLTSSPGTAKRFSFLLVGVLRFCGLVLMLAGLFKLRQYGPPLLSGVWSEDFGLIFIGFAEAILGSFLLLSKPSKLALILCLCIFGSFTVYQLYQYFWGPRFCDCLGGVPILAWRILVFDLILVLVVGVTFWKFRGAVAFWPERTGREIKIAVLVGLICASLTSGVAAGVNSARNEIVVRPQFGVVNAGELTEATIQIWNSTSEPIEIVGIQTSCGLKLGEPLPKSLTPNATTTLTLRIKGRESGGPMAVPITLFSKTPGRFKNTTMVYGTSVGVNR